MPTRHFCLSSVLLLAKHWRVLFILSVFRLVALIHCYSSYCISVVLNCSVFGEDALVNVSVEKKEDNDGKLAGYIRIRSKTQGIALSLGDRITSVQRGLLPKQ
jgi:hypothetical protein